MNTRTAKFDIGQLVRHRSLGVRGVVIDVIARDDDDGDEPAYQVLAEGTEPLGAVLDEQALEPDDDTSPLRNPAAHLLFAGFARGRYRLNRRALN